MQKIYFFHENWHFIISVFSLRLINHDKNQSYCFLNLVTLYHWVTPEIKIYKTKATQEQQHSCNVTGSETYDWLCLNNLLLHNDFICQNVSYIHGSTGLGFFFRIVHAALCNIYFLLFQSDLKVRLTEYILF